ncbi:MAG: CHASE domain-containing protein [Rhodospirillales bacterium]
MPANRHHRLITWFKGVVSIAVAYAVTGHLGLLLAIPPGYATAIWPASGIALAGVLVLGNRVWPGILIGSFLVNVWNGFDGSTADALLRSLAIPFCIGAGAALQALASAFLVRRFAGFPSALAGEKEVFSFLFWAGPVGCLVNPIIGVTTLYLAGIVPADVFVVNSATWWIGDAIGVFIFTPLVLVWTLRPTSVWRPRRLLVSAPVILAFVTTVIVVAASAKWELERLKLKFDQQASTLSTELSDTLQSYLGTLRFLEAFYQASENVTRDEFRTVVERQFDDLKGIKALSWNERVPQSRREAFEAAIRAEGFADFHITERSDDGELVPAGARLEHVVVTYIEPFKDNLKAFGFDVASNGRRVEALRAAAETGRAVATARVQLVQENGDQNGFLVFRPLFADGHGLDTTELRGRHLKGYLVGVFRINDIVHSAFDNLDTTGLAFQLEDLSADAGERLLAESQDGLPGVSELSERGLFGARLHIGKSYAIPIAGRTWQLQVAPNEVYLATNRNEDVWLTLVVGMLLTSLVCTFVLVISGRNVLLGNLVEERTRTLRLSESRLAAAQRIALLGNWEWDLEKDSLWFSDEIHRLFELDPGNFDKKFDSYLALIHPNDRNVFRQCLEFARSRKEPFSIDHRAVMADGREKDIHVQGEVSIGPSGEVTRILGTAQDISERMKLDRMKAEFISNVSHELRTPLTSIKGSLGLLRGGAVGEVSDKAKKMAQIAYANCDRLILLVNDILEMDRATSGQLAYHMETLPIRTLIHDAVEAYSSYGNDRGVRFSVMGGLSDSLIFADRDRLLQVLANFMSNAAKFSPDGETVVIGLRTSGGWVRVSVTDNGPGIPEAFKSKIFERFAQADGTTSRETGGTGLGLAITKVLVEQQGGKVGFDSKEGSGSTFFFELPEHRP